MYIMKVVVIQEYHTYLKTQAMAVLKQVASQYPYESKDGHSLKSEAVEVGPGENSVDGLVKTAIYMGTHTHLQVDVGGKKWDIHSRVDDRVAVGDAIKLRFPPEVIWALPFAEVTELEDVMTPAAPE